MGTVRTVAHDKILNYFAARETSGTTADTERGVKITDASMSFTVSNAIGINISQNTALTAGAWQVPATGSSWALLLLINMNDGTVNSFAIGNSTSDDSIEIASDGIVRITGADGGLELNGQGPQKQVATRFLLTYDAGSDVRIAKSPLGAALILDSTEYDATVCGDLTTLGAFMSANTFGAKQVLYGMQMVEFVNGLPAIAEVVTNADATFTQWEAGNKTYYPLYGDE